MVKVFTELSVKEGGGKIKKKREKEREGERKREIESVCVLPKD